MTTLTTFSNLTCQNDFARVAWESGTNDSDKSPATQLFSYRASVLICGTTIEKGKARLRSSRLQRALRTESEPPQISKIEWLNVTTINLDKALTPSKASLELAHLPRTWPEAKLIAPVLLPAPRFTYKQPVGVWNRG